MAVPNYAKQTWTNGAGGGTPLNATRLDGVENGIEDAGFGYLMRTSSTLPGSPGDLQPAAESDTKRLGYYDGTAWRYHGAVLLAESVLSAPATNVTFSNIPADFRHLRIEGCGRSDNTTDDMTAVRCQCNADTTAGNYDHAMQMVVNGTAFAAQSTGALTYMTVCRIPTNKAGAASDGGGFIVDFPRYRQASFRKTFLSQWFGRYAPGNLEYASGGGQWRSTSAITSIKFGLGGTDSWDTGSTFSLYGLM